jgi:hypothetical protein
VKCFPPHVEALVLSTFLNGSSVIMHDYICRYCVLYFLFAPLFLLVIFSYAWHLATIPSYMTSLAMRENVVCGFHTWFSS